VTNALTEMNYDARKLPLGKLAKSTLLQGFAALKELAEVISDQNCATAKELGGFKKACDELTGRYYS
jgi:poly [ADP-ribose] polymerase